MKFSRKGEVGRKNEVIFLLKVCHLCMYILLFIDSNFERKRLKRRKKKKKKLFEISSMRIENIKFDKGEQLWIIVSNLL